MEFLPEETMLAICDQMDLSDLAKFSQTSKTHKRICSEVLKKRRDEFVDEILDIASGKSFYYIELYSNKDRIFQLYFKVVRFADDFLTNFTLKEIFTGETFIIKKLYSGSNVYPSVEQIIDTIGPMTNRPSGVGVYLNKLIDAGYLNGKYKVFYE